MDFNKKEIHTSRLLCSKYSELTIDDDFNIPDVKGDIDTLIAQTGNVCLEETSCEEGKVYVCGTVYFKVLYKTDDNEIEVIEGDIPFEERINMEQSSKDVTVECQSRLEDLTVSMINSRKIEVRGLIGNDVSLFAKECKSAIIGIENGQGVECQCGNANITEAVVAKKDAFRIKEEVLIPQSKPNIKELMWDLVSLRNMDVKAGDEKLIVHGEVEIFAIYKADEEEMPIQYLYSVRSISKELPCDGAKEGMLLEAEVALGKGETSVKPDDDGEERIIAVDFCVDMNIKMYEDQEVELMTDLYSTKIMLLPVREKLVYENMLMRNAAKAKISHKKQVDHEKETILQICHVYGTVEVDDVNIEKASPDVAPKILVYGVVKTNVLYVSADDDPMRCMQEDIPFEYQVDLSKNQNVDDISVRIVPSIDQLNATLLNSEEVEIKAQVNLNISVVECKEVFIISDVNIKEIDMEKKAAVPGIVGYIVKPGDTIWSVARKYYATTESIREMNKLESDELTPGDRLMIVKS